MSKSLHITSKMGLLLLAFVFLFSCSKDADLLSEYVINDNDDVQSLAILTNDSFYMAPGQNTILMDVLNNDNLDANTNITIIETSTPINGIVTINDDNTLTYRSGESTPEEATPEEATPEEATPEEATPEEATPEEATPVEDTFTYTAEVVDEETGEVTVEEAIVTVTSVPSTDDNNSNEILDMGELLAFPGAEGFGKYTVGGRGGKIIHVTNLNNDGEGSLRAALESTGKRTVVFDVGGDILLEEMIKIGIGNANASPATNALREDVTIAGETAPFPGITLRTKSKNPAGYGALLNIQSSNVIVRYISFRVDDDNISSMDALQILNPWHQTGNYKLENIILDHVSMSNGSDENFSVRGINDVTVQNSMITNSDNDYSFLFAEKNYNFSFIGNYISHTNQRNVLVGYGTHNSTSEYINNIIYGHKEGMFMTYGNILDVIGNIYKAFPSVAPNAASITWRPNEFNNPEGKITDGSFFVADNHLLNSQGNNLYNNDAITLNSPSRKITNSVITNWLTNLSEIEDRVLKNNAPGNSLHQDELDSQAISDYFNNTGNQNPLSVPNKPSTKHPDNYDTDYDGMADDWERNYFGDLSKKPNEDHDGDGYTNIEVFFASITK